MIRRLAVASVCVSILCLSGTAAAASAPGISVSPAIVQLSLNQMQTEATFPVRITNMTGAPVVISVEASEFAAQGDTGGIRFLDASESAADGHGLAALLAGNRQMIPLANGTTETITMRLTDVSGLAAGGHYAALLYRVSGSGANGNVSIQPAVATLVFVSTEGKGTQEVQLSTPLIGVVEPSLPDRLDVVFSNTGNTQTAPHGVIQVVDPSGHVAGQGVINADSGLILPGSKRLFTVQLTAQTMSLRWPGVYHLKVLYRHEGQADYVAYDKPFLYMNVWLALLLLAAVLSAVVVARWLAGRFIISRHRRQHIL